MFYIWELKLVIVQLLNDLAGNLHQELVAEEASPKVIRTGRPARKEKIIREPIGKHLPTFIHQRRRCIGCTSRGKEKRVQYICLACDEPLCLKCFAPYHERLLEIMNNESLSD